MTEKENGRSFHDYLLSFVRLGIPIRWVDNVGRKRGQLAIATVKRRKRGAETFQNQLGNVFKTFGNSRDETFQIEQTE